MGDVDGRGKRSATFTHFLKLHIRLGQGTDSDLTQSRKPTNKGWPSGQAVKQGTFERLGNVRLAMGTLVGISFAV
ncbi:hypothetical protein Cob_v010959 [Colletotrichum orbiculare MAFF 240422]|uniref:Uncharacterized protein n=1 Tax=Colletotrichum orbiculare (strain 104-T / ATCC 96160 / CBS 514.97 / LARS 414 / MAFF 240422) TaxID=1213857 RepID=A0A484FEQ2_COLOR|nr:hypothetical protein Cob_v010959 [Colletotrichum orbiculare MAFF 240422]